MPYTKQENDRRIRQMRRHLALALDHMAAMRNGPICTLTREQRDRLFEAEFPMEKLLDSLIQQPQEG